MLQRNHRVLPETSGFLTAIPRTLLPDGEASDCYEEKRILGFSRRLVLTSLETCDVVLGYCVRVDVTGSLGVLP